MKECPDLYIRRVVGGPFWLDLEPARVTETALALPKSCVSRWLLSRSRRSLAFSANHWKSVPDLEAISERLSKKKNPNWLSDVSRV